jgi:ATP-dependent Lon protease
MGDDADGDVGDVGELGGGDAQHGALAEARIAREHGESALAEHDVHDPPAELEDGRRGEQGVHTSFSYTLQETGEEKFVGVPEQGGRDLISTDPVAPGTVYTAGVTSDGTVGLYRLEVSVSSGTGKLKLAGGIAGAMKESVQRAFSYLQAKKSDLGIARDLDVSDLHVEVIDLLANRVEAELGVAFFVACYSAMRKAPVTPALLILGDMSVQGNIKPLRSLVEPLQVAKDNGAKRALIPIENKRNFLDVSADIMEHGDPIFFGDPKTAAMKVLGGP